MNPEFAKDEKSVAEAPFCPPGDGNLALWLARLLEIGGPILDLDGLRVPQLRIPSDEIKLEFEDQQKLELSAEAERAARSVEGGVMPLHPGRYPRFTVEVAYLSDIEGMPDPEIARYLQSAEHGAQRARRSGLDYRGVRRLRSSGRVVWAELGAWPWALFPKGRLPEHWRGGRDVAAAIRLWHSTALRSTELRVRRARALHSPVGRPVVLPQQRQPHAEPREEERS